jgi:hypothetical protein
LLLNEGSGMSEPEKSANWEREVLEKLAMAALKEQRVARHWSYFLTKFWVSVFLFLILSASWAGSGTTQWK